MSHPDGMMQRVGLAATDTADVESLFSIVLPVWGERGAPLVPVVFRRALSHVGIPPDGLVPGSDLKTFDELDASAWDRGVNPERILTVVGDIIGAAINSYIRTLPALGAWPDDLDPWNLRLRQRTRSNLLRAGYLYRRDASTGVFLGAAPVPHDPDRAGTVFDCRALATATLGDLMAIPGLGLVSLLDFLCTAEVALQHRGAVIPVEPASPVTVLELPDVNTADSMGHWGEPGVPLLPEVLREILRNRPIPEGVATPQSSLRSCGELDATAWGYGINEAKLRRALADAVNPVLGRLRDVPIVAALPRGIDLTHLVLRERTRNALRRERVIDPADPGATRIALEQLTYGAAAKIMGFGVSSMLDLACSAEALMQRAQVLPVAPVPERHVSGEFAAAQEQLLGSCDFPWFGRVTANDPRFRHVFVGSRQTLEQVVEAAFDDDDSLWRALRTVDSCVTIAQAIEALPDLPSAIEHLLVALTSDERERTTFAERNGLHGEDVRTLEQVGSDFGVTRERIRQIENRVSNRCSGPLYLPQLETVLEVLAAEAPVSSDDVRALSGLCPRPLLALAERAGYPTDLTYDRVRDALGFSNGADEPGRAVARAVGAVAKPWRIFHRDLVQEQLVTEVAEADLDRLLERCARRLCDGWWWIPTEGRNNAFGNLVQMIASVPGHIDVRDLHEGLARRARWRKCERLLPPVAALLEYCVQHDAFIVDGSDIRCRDPLDWRSELGAVENGLIESILAAPGHVLDRNALTTECVDKRGLNASSVSVYTTFSPFIQHLGVNLWGVRGIDPDPIAVEMQTQSSKRRPRRKHVVGWGWSEEGGLVLDVSIRGGPSEVVGIPAAMRPFLTSSRYMLVPRDTDDPVGDVRIDDGTSWGYTPLLARLGAVAGDIVRIEFDLIDEIAWGCIVDASTVDLADDEVDGEDDEDGEDHGDA